jgi:hypothetical protein
MLASDFLNDIVGTDMAEKEPKSASWYSYLEPNEKLNVIGSPNFRCLVGLPSSSLPVFSYEFALRNRES